MTRHVHVRFLHDPSIHNSICQAVYEPGSTLVGPPRVPSPQHRSPLGTGAITAELSSISTGAGHGSSSRLSVRRRAHAPRTAPRPGTGRGT